MNNSFKKINVIGGWFCFVFASMVYLLTMEMITNMMGLSFTLSPTDPIYTELIDRLESRKYLPLYLNTTVRTTTLDYVTTLTFEQNGADYIFSFCGDRAMDVKGVKTRTVQLKNYEAFQSSLLALLLGQV